MKTIAFLLFDDVEVLDFSGPFDVFSMSSIATGSDLFKLITVSRDGKCIKAIHGLEINPSHSIADIAPGDIDILIIPGGAIPVIDALGEGAYADLVEWIKGIAPSTKITASVCVGAFFAAKAGLFANLNATTHHGLLDRLVDWTKDQGTTVLRGPRYVDSGHEGPMIWSSAGVSAGIDMSFALLQALEGAEVRAKTQQLMEYNATTNWAAQTT